MNSQQALRYFNDLRLCAYLLERGFILSHYYSDGTVFYFGFEPHPDLDGAIREFRIGAAIGNIQQVFRHLDQLKDVVFGEEQALLRSNR